MWSTSVKLVYNILHANNTVFAEVGLNEGVVSERNALVLDFGKSALVHKFSDGSQVGVTE